MESTEDMGASNKEKSGDMRGKNRPHSKKTRVITFKYGELFSGAGGLAYGAVHSSCRSKNMLYRVEHAWANDIHEESCRTYRRNICSGDPSSVICGDIRKINLHSLPGIDALAFGFPCNDFSIVGERKGINGSYGPLYMYGVEVLDIFKPRWFLAENVSGITSANSGEAFQQILRDLEKAGGGYELTVHKYEFEKYGVPQTRHRIIIVGISREEKLKFKVPAPTTPYKFISAREAIENPPIPEDASNNELTRQSPKVVKRLMNIPPGRNVWNSGLHASLQLNVKGAKLSQIYRRLHPDEPAYTITGSGGGGTHGYHWAEPRALTNRERARLQTFPDEFIFEGSKESVRRQIGMAVPPKGARTIVTAILKTFAGVSYPSIPSNWSSDEKQLAWA